jgi:muramoyltetrapeptide carboxypeptidase
VEARNLRRVDGVFAGTDDERLDGFHELLADADLRAIFFMRGGHGIVRLLDRIDWELVGRTPRVYVGYSDLTPFLMQVVGRLNLVAIHGPMVAADMARGLDRDEGASLLELLSGKGSVAYELAGPVLGDAASGPLVGGCLSLLTATIGTDYHWKSDGGVLFWEDVDEPFYRLDRMLTQLRLSGSVSALSGMVVGDVGLQPDEIDRLRLDFDCTFASGLSCGHCRPNLPLPLGAVAAIDPSGTIRCELG